MPIITLYKISLNIKKFIIIIIVIILSNKINQTQEFKNTFNIYHFYCKLFFNLFSINLIPMSKGMFIQRSFKINMHYNLIYLFILCADNDQNSI